MNKFRKATKRIAAVAASATVASSSVFASLADYPQNFVSNDAFNGEVVVGADAAAIDTTSAEALIDDLRTQFSGEANQVKLSYRMTTGDGEERSVARSNTELNYGETINNVTETFDDADMDLLEDETFNNGKSDEDYEQTLLFSGGEFNHALRDEVSGVDQISDNVFFEAGTVFATYTLDLDNEIVLNTTGYDQSDLEDDFVGEEIVLLGNEFTIAEISRDGADLNELTLIGGANKVSLGEGESLSIEVDGESYEVEVLNVDTEASTSKVLVVVNGESSTVDEYDTEDIAGITVAVTDLVGSGRDSVKGYAELVIGGQKVKLFDDNREVEVNEEDLSDVFDEYRVTSDFSDAGAGINTITVTYAVDDDTSLEEGDMLSDVLFQGFDLVFEGTNEPDFSTIEIRAGSDDLSVDGTLESGMDFNRNLYTYDDDNAPNGNLYLTGSNDEDLVFVAASAGINATDITLPSGISYNATHVSFNLTDTGVIGSGFLLYDDDENQYLYEISSIDAVDVETDLDELLDDKNEEALDLADWATQLEETLPGSSTSSGDTINIPFTDLGNIIAFENEALLTIVAAYDDSLTTTESAVHFRIGLDSDDVDGDQTDEEFDAINLTVSYDNTDDELDIKVLTGNNSDFQNVGEADVEDDSSDLQRFVTRYGIMVEYDNDESTSVKVMVPEEQVRANLMVRSGGSSVDSGSVTVDASEADAREAELEEEGYTVTREDVTSEEVDFDVTSPMLDTDMVALGQSAWNDMIVVGGPAVNQVAAMLLGLSYPTFGDASGVSEGEGLIRYFEDSNSVLVYGYSGADTREAVDRLNSGGLSGEEERLN